MVLGRAPTEKAFEELKQKLTVAPILAYPDWDKGVLRGVGCLQVGAIAAAINQKDERGRL